jgi:hypothetical protein
MENAKFLLEEGSENSKHIARSAVTPMAGASRSRAAKRCVRRPAHLL